MKDLMTSYVLKVTDTLPLGEIKNIILRQVSHFLVGDWFYQTKLFKRLI